MYMLKNVLHKPLNWIAKNFSKDPSKMLIWTGVAGWAASSIAQVGALLFNPKLDDEQKSFLVPQEICDAITNIVMFFVITKAGQLFARKLFQTGKIAPKSVRNFLNENKALYKDKIGKIAFNIDDLFLSNQVKKDYETYKSLGTTLATVGCGILASNVVTPIVRNNMASWMQKNYIEAKNYDVPKPNMAYYNYSGNMRI